MYKPVITVITNPSNTVIPTRADLVQEKARLEKVLRVRDKIENLIEEASTILEVENLEKIEFNLVMLDENDEHRLDIRWLQSVRFINEIYTEGGQVNEIEIFRTILKTLQIAEKEIRIEEMAQEVAKRG